MDEFNLTVELRDAIEQLKIAHNNDPTLYDAIVYSGDLTYYSLLKFFTEILNHMKENNIQKHFRFGILYEFNLSMPLCAFKVENYECENAFDNFITELKRMIIFTSLDDYTIKIINLYSSDEKYKFNCIQFVPTEKLLLPDFYYCEIFCQSMPDNISQL
jgi:hypothetical protein